MFDVDTDQTARQEATARWPAGGRLRATPASGPVPECEDPPGDVTGTHPQAGG